ncbi:MAG: tRNA (N(6)-L-threonylcarbamoyladenosine(37)-C(2))-methylthiotransferase MtaB [Elusimicrobia bacterium]|nr:tRNA (N(6)-L-threonylcarbamoyladenosine(37)-C(2))-methylthiotransferase MtaB [Elusimicrobiota bacterium]
MATFAIHTLGCKTNQAEGDQIADQLTKHGLQSTAFKNKSDIYIINSCTVTQRADKKTLRFIKQALKQNSKAKIFLIGCYRKFADKELPVEIIEKEKLIKKFNGKSNEPQGIPKPHPHIRRNLLIQTGCENFCSYCIVPYVRGKNKFKPLNEILNNANELIETGAKEIVLTGTNLGTHKELITIIKKLSRIKDLIRIRLSSIEPMYINKDLIECITNNPKVCPHLHIPLQSGDNDILQAMKRNYTREDFLELIKMIRKHVPDMSFNTDILVGFPGETDKQFNNTIDLIKRINFSRIHVFSFSKRPLTAAYKLPDFVDPKTIKERALRTKDLGKKLINNFIMQNKDKNIEILVEQKNKQGLWEGLSPHYLRCAFSLNQNLFGKVILIPFIKVKQVAS